MNATPINKFLTFVRHTAEVLELRKFVVAIGAGLILASLQLDLTIYGYSEKYWNDPSAAAFIVTLTLIGLILLLANVLLMNDRFLSAASAVGAVLFGFFIFLPLTLGIGHLGDLRYGSWFALAGGATIALGAAPYRMLTSWSKEAKRPGWPLLGTWLVAGLGFALVIVAIPLALSSNELANSLGVLHHPSFWDSVGVATGGHTLGIALIVLVAVAVVSVLGAALLRARLFGFWAVAAALVLLGVTLYYPVHLAMNHLDALRTGAGLALEGALLAAGATVVACLSQRGVVRLNRSSLRQLVAVVGMGLALAGTWTETFAKAGLSGSYWGDETLGGFPTLLVGVGVVLVAVSFVVRRWWILSSVSALGWIVAGFFAFDLVGVIPNTGRLGPATWLGVVGGVLAGLSAASLPVFTRWQRSPVKTTLRRAAVWVAVGAGLGLFLASLWLDTQAPFVASGKTFHNTYWNTGGDRSLGITMLVLGVLAAVALVGFAIARIPLLGAWTLAASLALLGLAVRLPAELAFNHLGFLRSGGWLALAGALLASVGAAKMLVCDWPLDRAKPEEETTDEVKSHSHAPVKGKQRRVPETRRAR